MCSPSDPFALAVRPAVLPLRNRASQSVGSLRSISTSELDSLGRAANDFYSAASHALAQGGRVIVAGPEESLIGGEISPWAAYAVHPEAEGTSEKRGASPHGTSWRLTWLHVAPPHRGEHFGRQLLFDALGNVAHHGGTTLAVEDRVLPKSFLEHLLLDIAEAGYAKKTWLVTPPFVAIDEVAPSILVDLRYRGSDNFVGRPIEGYQQARAMLTRKAATALKKAQALASEHKLSLKVFDAYRPVRAVEDFAAWSQDAKDDAMREQYYPHLQKPELFTQQYIVHRSGHSRGSTLDCTLVPLTPTNYDVTPHDGGIEMGTRFDFFDPTSHTAAAAHGSLAARNRALLVEIMDASSFENYAQEWWHFTLRDEPYPDTYFDFHA